MTGSSLTTGTIVYISSGQGNKAVVSKAQANAESTSYGTYGMVRETIPNNSNGYVTISGIVTDLDTSAFAEGTVLYLSPTVAGAFTHIKPIAPNHMVYVGVVIYSHQNHGSIQTRIQNGFELDELHDVYIISPTDNSVLTFDSSLGLWKNKDIVDILPVTLDISISEMTENYAYFGGTLSTGGWQINKWTISTNVKTVATQLNNSSKTTLTTAWADRTTLTYN
jgi:hypothetical protein